MSQLSQEEAELLTQENRFLKQTILNLRGELERASEEQLSLLQSKTLEFSNEIKVLKQIIETQRDENEKIAGVAEDEKQSIRSSSIQNENQLKEVIKNLRLELEITRSKSEETIQKAIGQENLLNLGLKKSLLEIRHALDKSEAEKSDIEQKAKRGAQQEIQQLQKSSRSLRKKIDFIQ